MTDNSKRAPNILMYAPSLLKALERVALAPARGYLAQSPQADFGGGWLGNALTQAHKNIDPVNAMGGYGGLLAMALPPGRAIGPRKPVSKPSPLSLDEQIKMASEAGYTKAQMREHLSKNVSY